MLRVSLGRQGWVKINPPRIVALDQLDLPPPPPFLDLPLAARCRCHRFMRLEPDQPIDTVFGCEAGHRFGLMLPNSPNDIGSAADVESSVQPAREVIDEEHRAAAWWVPAFAGTRLG